MYYVIKYTWPKGNVWENYPDYWVGGDLEWSITSDNISKARALAAAKKFPTREAALEELNRVSVPAQGAFDGTFGKLSIVKRTDELASRLCQLMQSLSAKRIEKRAALANRLRKRFEEAESAHDALVRAIEHYNEAIVAAKEFLENTADFIAKNADEDDEDLYERQIEWADEFTHKAESIETIDDAFDLEIESYEEAFLEPPESIES